MHNEKACTIPLDTAMRGGNSVITIYEALLLFALKTVVQIFLFRDVLILLQLFFIMIVHTRGKSYKVFFVIKILTVIVFYFFHS